MDETKVKEGLEVTRGIKSVIFCTMDSLYSTLILNNLSDEEYQKIKLIVLSDRYSGRHGSFLNQLFHNFHRSGLNFVIYLSYVFVIHKVLCFFSGRFLTIRQLALSKKIPILETADVNSELLTTQLIKLAPDLIVSCYFDQLFKKSLYSIPRFGTINIHPGPLPNYRGPFPTFWLLSRGEKSSAVTVHRVDDSFDTGDILYLENVSLPNLPTVLSADRIILFKIPVIIKKLLNNEINLTGSVQEPHKAKYYSFPSKNDIRNARRTNLKLFNLKDLVYFTKQ